MARDSKGRELAQKVEYISQATNNMAEFRAALSGLELGKTIRASKLHLEGDFLVIVNAIRSNFTLNWLLHRWLPPIWTLISSFKEFQVSHVYREGNTVAVSLEKGVVVEGRSR